MIHCFHCPAGEYQKLSEEIRKKWVIAHVIFTRNEWHITAVWRDYLNRLRESTRERLMQRLAYSSQEVPDGCTQGS